MASVNLLPRFDLEAPESLSQACTLLAQAGREARVLAGGTDLLVKMKLGQLRPRLILSLGRLRSLMHADASADGGLSIGSLATMAQLAGHAALCGGWRALADGAEVVGGPIIRNRATIGGNIINARPCADTASPLIAMGARLRLKSQVGERVVDADGFITGPGQTQIEPDEILTAIELPAQDGGRQGSAYLKVTRRSAMEVTVVGCAVSLRLRPDGETIDQAGLVLTSVGPTPVAARQVEALLAGRSLDAQALAEAAIAARQAALPIDDHRSTAAYRVQVVEVLAQRALRLAARRAGKEL